MLSHEEARQGRVQIATTEEYLERLAWEKHPEAAGRARRITDGRDIVLHGFVKNDPVTFPYPGPRSTSGPAVALYRDQAEDLVIELLKKLNGGEMPTDSAELVDFISSLSR